MPAKKKPLLWLRLDNAAKIYPAARSQTWSNTFRLSATLSGEIDIPVLENALVFAVRRFPSIGARLRKGLFWYYLQQLPYPPEVRQESSYPLTYMSPDEARQCAFRVLVWHDRIAVEFFHSRRTGHSGSAQHTGAGGIGGQLFEVRRRRFRPPAGK